MVELKSGKPSFLVVLLSDEVGDNQPSDLFINNIFINNIYVNYAS